MTAPTEPKSAIERLEALASAAISIHTSLAVWDGLREKLGESDALHNVELEKASATIRRMLEEK